MEILINNQPAALKKGTNFEYVLENRYFSGVDDYTLSIEFPMKDCITNQRIFGRINTHEAKVPNTLYHCVISSGTLHFEGVLKIVSTSDVSVKGQFMAGRTAENYASSFDDIIINTLNLPYPDVEILRDSDIVAGITEAEAANRICYNWTPSQNYKVIPWYSEGTGKLQNARGSLVIGGLRAFSNDIGGVSIMPKLCYLLELIFGSINYTCDLTAIDQSYVWNDILVCNALPYAWDMHNFNRALPAWSLSKLLEQIEYLLNGFFNVDHIRKHVHFEFARDVFTANGSVALPNVFDSFETEEEDAEDSEYRESIRLQYAEEDHEMQKFYSCQWLIDDFRKEGLIKEITDLSAFKNLLEVEARVTRSGGWAYWKAIWGYELSNKIMHVQSVDEYFLVTDIATGNIGTNQYGLVTAKVYNINNFAPSGDGKVVELDIIPVRIDEYYNSSATSEGECVFLNTGEYSETEPTADSPWKGNAFDLLNHDKTEGKSEYLSKLYFAIDYMRVRQNMYAPTISRAAIINLAQLQIASTTGRFDVSDHAASLKLRWVDNDYSFAAPKIDGSRKYKFQWLSNSLPKIESVFIIHGHKFMCSKITATFTEDGMSQKLKGEFYRVID